MMPKPHLLPPSVIIEVRRIRRIVKGIIGVVDEINLLDADREPADCEAAKVLLLNARRVIKLASEPLRIGPDGRAGNEQQRAFVAFRELMKLWTDFVCHPY